MGRTKIVRELKHRLEQLLRHLIKLEYIDDAYNRAGWLRTVAEQRERIRWLGEDILPHLDGAWRKAGMRVAEDYDFRKSPFGTHCPLSVDAVLGYENKEGRKWAKV